MDTRPITFDYSKLRGRIIEKYRTYTKFAEDIGWESSYLSRKLGGEIAFTLSDIVLFRGKLGILPEQIGDIFFTLEVQ